MTATGSEGELEQRTANLRKVATIGLAGDLVAAAVLILMKDSLGTGDMIYFLAAVLVAAGSAMFVILPRIPRMTAERARETMSEPKTGSEKK